MSVDYYYFADTDHAGPHKRGMSFRRVYLPTYCQSSTALWLLPRTWQKYHLPMEKPCLKKSDCPESVVTFIRNMLQSDENLSE